MKRMISLLLVLALCLSLCACGTGNETHDYILSLLEQEEYDMAIYVIEGLRDGKTGAQQPEQQMSQTEEELPALAPGGNGDSEIVLEPERLGNDLLFHMDLINYQPFPLTLDTLLIVDWLNGQELGTHGFEGADLERIGLGGLVLQPNQGTGWDDGHPVTTDFDRRDYLFVFRNDQGEKIRFRFIFELARVVGEGPVDGGAQPVGDWQFFCPLENTGDSPWELIAMDITDLRNGERMGTYIFQDSDLGNIGLGGVVLQPGESLPWMDGHPATSDWNGREYRFHFRDAKGQSQIQSFLFENLDAQPTAADYSQDAGKDLKTLRHDASFEIEVSPGVYWVNASSLGASRYSNQDIHGMLPLTPEDKQAEISTLYEALQLYQIGNFTPSDDNQRIYEGGVNWEHHKPGYHAVRTNTGCCATDSNWLRYILDGDYDEVGFIATSQRDGSGHVYNYILQGGWYYIIDLTHYHASGSPIDTAVENGDMNMYRATDFILGNIHKVQNLQDYVAYVQQTFNDPPGLMFQYTAENVLAVDGPSSQSGVQIIYEEAAGQSIQVIFDDPSDSLTFRRAPSPQSLPDWAQLPDGNFG